MIFKEAVGAAQRFVHNVDELPEQIRSRADSMENWSQLAVYLGELETALGAIDIETGTTSQRPGLVFEFYERGLSRIRQQARTKDV